ncbi:DNA polymerase III subunit delta [Candidatus Pelagibacter sp.]|nr:DNA polymerase III subunit delta [Candidatus Pelagibacter sp.]
MIIKTFEIDKKKYDKQNFFLVYGENEGLKNEIIQTIKKNLNGVVENFDETQINNDKQTFYEKIFNRSLFEKEKIIIINRCSEKIYDVIENIVEGKISDIKIILNASVLEKKSKLRNMFEKRSELVIVPTYKDTSVTLLEIAKKFFYNYKISISQETINLLVNRCNGNRGHLKSELDKILVYMNDKKSVNLEEIYKLTNLSENYAINELVDTSLSKNAQRTSEIINESNYKSEEAIIILRTFLQKAKRLLNLYETHDGNLNYDNLVNNCVPPIFWKDKPIIKKQLEIWSKLKIKNLIMKINKTEIYIKKNSSISLMLVFNFIYETSNKS